MPDRESDPVGSALLQSIVRIVHDWKDIGRETAFPNTQLCSDWMNRQSSRDSADAPRIQLSPVPDYLVMAELVREYGSSFTVTTSCDGDWQVKRRVPVGLDFDGLIETLISEEQLEVAPGTADFECFRLPDGRIVRAFNGKYWEPNPWSDTRPSLDEMAMYTCDDWCSVLVEDVMILAARPLRPSKADALHMPPYTDRFLKLTEKALAGDLAPQGHRISATKPRRDRPYGAASTPVARETMHASKKKRRKREVVEPLIIAHLSRCPHATAKEVAKAVGSSVGVVAESEAWKLNQKRLKAAKRLGSDPKAVRLNEKAINSAGGGRMGQLHDHRQKVEEGDDELDRRERELFRQIGEFKKAHPDATPEETAKSVGCCVGDVERRQAKLDVLAAEQAESAREDSDEADEDEDARHSKRKRGPKWINKQV